MNNEAAIRRVSPAQTLIPVYIPPEVFAVLQKDDKVFEYVALNSRSSEKSLFENFKLTAIVYYSPPGYPMRSDPIAPTNHSPPSYQKHSEPEPLVVNNNKNSSKGITVFERVALDFDARFSKSELKSKAEKAANEFLDALAPGSTADIDSAVHKFRTSTNEISARFEKFKTSSLAAGIESDISNAMSQIAVKKFIGTGSKVDAACIQNVQKALALINKSETETPDLLEDQACKHIANQTLKIFQEQLFINLKIGAKKATNDLLSASKPGSKTSIERASIDFNEKMIMIFDQKVHVQDSEVYESFESEIKKSVNGIATDIFNADLKKNNKADWIMTKMNLGKENNDVQDRKFSGDIQCASTRLKIQLRWMNEQDFLENVERGIKGCFNGRFEKRMVGSSLERINKNTETIIKELKLSITLNCPRKNEQEIASEVQINRERFAKLLLAGDNKSYTLPEKCSLNFFKTAVENYLNNNTTELDLAISGLVIDHLKNVEVRGLLH